MANASKKTATKANATPPARRAQLNPQASDDPVAKASAAVTKGLQTSADAVKQAKEEGDDIVNVRVPQAFRLTDDNRVETQYTAETRTMPRSHAEHDYSVANGVEILK